MGGFAWVTLATNDSYSLGALVLAHSLKRSGTCHQLAVLVTPGVTNAMRVKLSSVFNVLQEVNILDSKDEANLRLLKRPELGITFTKLHCWRLTQFEKCVFLDADTLVLKNCDELFERDEFSAAPDVGWPDCFNSGVFVYRPSNETYEKLVQFALEKGSFDGGDQGLLNLYFSDWAHKDINKHLPFIYNMCSTACYSYLPAFKQFGSEVKIVHFISSTKPWLQYFDTESKQVQPAGDMQHLKTLLQCWWDIFCSVIHPNLTSDMGGLAGAFAQFSLGSPRSPTQVALEDHLRRQGWEVGNIDYMGRDSFDNIWSKICETLASGPQQDKPEESSNVEQPQKEEKPTSVDTPVDVKISESETKVETNKAEEPKKIDEKVVEPPKLEQPVIEPITSETKLEDTKPTEEKPKIEDLPKSLEASNVSEEIPKVLEVIKTEISKVAEEIKPVTIVKTTEETTKVQEEKPTIKLVEEVPKPAVVTTTDAAKPTEEKGSTESKASRDVMPVNPEIQEISKPSQETVKQEETKSVDAKTSDAELQKPKVEAVTSECSKSDSKLKEKVECSQIECTKPDSKVGEKVKSEESEAKEGKPKDISDVGKIQVQEKVQSVSKECMVVANLEDKIKSDSKEEIKVEIKPEMKLGALQIAAKTAVQPEETDISAEKVQTELKLEGVKRDDAKSLDAEIKPIQEVKAEVKLEDAKIEAKCQVDRPEPQEVAKVEAKCVVKPEEKQTNVKVEKPADVKPDETKIEQKSEETKVETKPEDIKSEVKEEPLTPTPEEKQGSAPVVECKKGKGKKDKKKPPVECPKTESPRQEPKSEEKCSKAECPKAESPKEKSPRTECPKEKCEKKDCSKKSKSKASVESKPEIPKTPEVIEASPPTSPSVSEKSEEKALGVETPILATPPPQTASTAPTPPPRKGSGGKKAKAKK